jgi:beta-glucosidase
METVDIILSIGNIKLSVDYSTATMANWQDIAKKAQEKAIQVDTDKGKITIRLLLGTDAVHGNQHVLGTILFPHNIGLAASHNPQNFANAATWNAAGIKASGFNFAFAPTVAVSHNPQWGRFYETMGDNAIEVRAFAKAYVKALQADDGMKISGVLASTKHFLGDGATFNGNDEGNDKVYNMK